METKYFKTTIVLISLGLFINSCRKNQPGCSGNCVDISISGNTYIKTSNVALANVPVEVAWFRKSSCIGCTSYKVGSGKTGNDGKFNINATIDSTYFRDYFLSVKVFTNESYITVPRSNSENYIEERFYDFNLNATLNLKFEFYPKTFLTINLHRTLSDNFNYFTVEHNFTSEFGYVDYIATRPPSVTDTSVKVETSADIYTRIVWKKVIVGGQSSQRTDSIICTNNGTNIFNINY